MNVELKPIAESKVRQLGGDVCGVLARKDGRLAAVDEHGRVQWLQDGQEIAVACAYCGGAEKVPAQQGSVLDGFSEFVSAVRSINRSSHHAIQIPGDDQPCFWQRKEWIDWIFELADKVEVAVQRALEATRMEADSRRPMFSTPTTPQPEGDGWVKCSERLPTEDDSDALGFVWTFSKGLGITVLDRHAFTEPPFYSHWKPTGLKRPQPPKEGGADEH